MHIEKVHSVENEFVELIKIETEDPSSKKAKSYTYFEVIEEPEDANEQ